jgi:hypothetical protein
MPKSGDFGLHITVVGQRYGYGLNNPVKGSDLIESNEKTSQLVEDRLARLFLGVLLL